MKKLLFFILILTIPTLSFAHGYWIEISGSNQVNQPATIRLYYGEYITGERLSGKFLDKMNEIKVYADSKEIVMKQHPDYWEGQFTPSTNGSYIITAINESREVQDWTKHNLGIVRPVQYLKTIYSVGSATVSTPGNLFLDATIIKEKPDTYKITVLKENTSFAEAKITVTHPDGEETYHTGSSAEFTTPLPGLYVIDVEWIDKTPGTFKGKDYASVRYKLNYSLYH